jgi:1-acyl-sn-glycerol-3-phosphate acyltransferase
MRHTSKEGPLLPADYYNSHPFTRLTPLHTAVRLTLRASLRTGNGPLLVQVPDSVRDLAGQPSVLAVNHRSWKDIPFGDFVARRAGFKKVRFPYKAEYDKAGLGVPFRLMGGIAVDRAHPDIQALTEVTSGFLGRGQSVLYFPESTRVKGDTNNNTRKVAKVYRGAAYLAASAHVPLIPIGIAGLADDDRFDRIIAVLGDPLLPRDDLPTERACILLNKSLQPAMQACLDIAYGLQEELAPHSYQGATTWQNL